MKIALFFPPGADPRSPHLALPSLAAFLRNAGHRVDLYDLNLGGLIHLVSPHNLAASARALAARQGAPDTGRLRAISGRLVDEAPRALAALRDPALFYDPHRYNLARDALADALALASAAHGRASFNVSPLDHRVEGVDPRSFRDLVAASDDPATNLFHHHWHDALFPALDESPPDIAGVTITNRQQLIAGLTLARALRRRGHFVVLGGTVFAKFQAKLARLPAFFDAFADAVVPYEGETALAALADALERGRDWADAPNLLYARGGGVASTRVHVESVDLLPTPDFTGLPLGDYLAPEPVLPILTGKGCYFNRCKFCDIPYINRVSKKAYRVRPAERVVEDCLALAARHGCRAFEITDEALSPKLLEQLADALGPARERAFRFVGYARLEPGFTPPLCRKLASAGVSKLFFGLESGSQATLDHMDKGLDVADAPAVLQNCRDAGIHFHVFSIVGFPEETAAEAEHTARFFADNAEAIDAPGNTFDIHPFGLDLRTPYFEGAAGLGVTIKPEALSGDFLISVPDRSWHNGRGLSPDERDALIGAFMARLRRTFARSHNHPGHLWPGFEEYAVLYARHYEGRPFPFTTALPERGERRRYRLRWHPLLARVDGGGRTWLQGRHGEARLSTKTFEAIEAMPFERFDETAAWLERAGGAPGGGDIVGRYRHYIHGLIGRGLLYLEVEPEAPSPAAVGAQAFFGSSESAP